MGYASRAVNQTSKLHGKHMHGFTSEKRKKVQFAIHLLKICTHKKEDVSFDWAFQIKHL
jgi:hypothetical protein